MRKLLVLVLLLSAFSSAAFCSLVVQWSGAQTRQAPAVRQMNITGEIARAAHGYIIRGRAPAEVFTILNPDPGILDKFVKSGRTVRITARIVSGDNVEIEKIEGRQYGGR